MPSLAATIVIPAAPKNPRRSRLIPWGMNAPLVGPGVGFVSFWQLPALLRMPRSLAKSRAARSVERPRAVRRRSGLFQDRIGGDHLPRNQVPPDAEVLERALGLGAAPQSLSAGTSTIPRLSVSLRMSVM